MKSIYASKIDKIMFEKQKHLKPYKKDDRFNCNSDLTEFAVKDKWGVKVRLEKDHQENPIYRIYALNQDAVLEYGFGVEKLEDALDFSYDIVYGKYWNDKSRAELLHKNYKTYSKDSRFISDDMEYDFYLKSEKLIRIYASYDDALGFSIWKVDSTNEEDYMEVMHLADALHFATVMESNPDHFALIQKNYNINDYGHKEISDARKEYLHAY